MKKLILLAVAFIAVDSTWAQQVATAAPSGFMGIGAMLFDFTGEQLELKTQKNMGGSERVFLCKGSRRD